MYSFKGLLKHIVWMGVLFCTLPHLQAQQPAGTAREPVPAVVRDAESSIERQFRRFGAGMRAGVSLDPELLNVGAHATIGPFFKQGIAFRPNVEYGFGELTKMFAINLEAVYFLPFDGDERRFYFGAGPGLNFIDRGLEVEEAGVDFDDFNYDTGLNLIGGVEWRSGAFLELKASAYGGPAIRVLLGYTF